ncbi:DmpA family aminopeptidase [Solibacillus silvestris]|uniref:DmpA family aminopeptidase n=1 Tax=Solibacillus silvestris TaxID=76853 RepID=UPI003F81FDB2
MKIRGMGLSIGQLQTGAKNCITDVEGVCVGHVTLEFSLNDLGDAACTGVTAILPHGGNLFREKVTAAGYILNGFGKTAGLIQVDELGVLESPIMLTNTFGVPAVTQGVLQYMLEQNEEIGLTTGTVNIVVGECNDSYLNSIRHCAVKPEHAIEAIRNATNEIAQEGAIGAGKGMMCFGYKGGIGSSSRIVNGTSNERFTVGCLVLSNFGQANEFSKERYIMTEDNIESTISPTDGSIIIVLATDAPLSSRQLKRVIKRCGIGLGRTGSHFSNGSGDIVIGFTTARKIAHQTEDIFDTRRQLRDDHTVMNTLFMAAAEATEEAIINSMSQAQTTTGRNNHTVQNYVFGK